MLHRYAILFGLGIVLGPATAQVQNALDFDGSDQVVVPNASDLLIGGTGITLTCWVYPRNDATAYPDFDGFAGIRNEFDADFYLLQVAPSDVLEGRLRTSDGTAYTLEYTGLELDTWQFLALTYDGAQLTIYHNGQNVATAPATGGISAQGLPLRIGNVLYDITDFFLDGRVDEVSLWDRGLSQGEVQCIQHEGIALDAEGLQLYFKMDQGTAGGDNAGVGSLVDAMGEADGAFEGLAMTGASSNFVAGPDVGNNLSATICPGGTYTFQGQVLDAPGIYTASFPTGGACDSIVTLTLDVPAVNVGVVQVGGTLTAMAPAGPYTWLDCGNGSVVVAGETGQSFTPSFTSTYAVVVEENGCADTSACYFAGPVGIEERMDGLAARLFPDPARDQVRIALDGPADHLDVVLADLNGREVRREAFRNVRTVDLRIGDLSEGVYLVRLRTEHRQGVFRLVKE